MYNFKMANRRLTFAHPVGHQEGAIFAMDREIQLDGNKLLYNGSFGGNIQDVQLGAADLVFTPNVSFFRHSLSGTVTSTGLELGIPMLQQRFGSPLFADNQIALLMP